MQQFANMFNQFMMNAMQTQQNVKPVKGKKKASQVLEVPKFMVQDSPQQEQFQSKIMDLMKKLQKKCETIHSEIKVLKA